MGFKGGSTSSGKEVWKEIWKSKCPNKIKQFLWRLTHNSHPLRCNLAWRGMHIDTCCVVYGRLDEDGAHLFFKCKLSKHIWCLLNLEAERAHLAAILDAYRDVECILKQREPKRELMVIILWFIWSERNIIREEGRRRPTDNILRCIELYAHENV